jgi:putative DNA primase/helicase
VPWGPDDPRLREAASLPETDLGLAERFAVWCGDGWRFRPGRGWMTYDGARWVLDEHGVAARSAVQQVVRAVTELEAPTLRSLSSDGRRRSARESRRQWGRSCETPRRIAAALESAETLPGLPVDEGRWDADPFLLDVANGLLDLRTGVLRPHDPAALCTAVVTAPWRPSATSPALDTVLRHLAGGDRSVVGFIARWLGYCLTGSTSVEAFLFLCGAAESGKSTLLTAFTDVLGDYADTAAADSFAVRTASSGATPELARLAGKRLIYVPEAGGIRLDVGRVKQVVGGDPVVARLLHQNPVTFRPRCKLTFTANELAVVPDDDAGLRRRLLPLRVTSAPPRRDSRLKAALDEPDGRAALLALAVRGALAWVRGGADLDALDPPATVRADLVDYLREMNPLEAWWDERVVLDAAAATTTSQLHGDYAEHCRRHGVRRVLGIKRFAQRLDALGYPVGADRTRGSLRHGLRLAG